MKQMNICVCVCAVWVHAWMDEKNNEKREKRRESERHWCCGDTSVFNPFRIAIISVSRIMKSFTSWHYWSAKRTRWISTGNTKWIPRWKVRHHLRFLSSSVYFYFLFFSCYFLSVRFLAPAFFLLFREENCHSLSHVMSVRSGRVVYAGKQFEENACLMCRYALEILIKLRFTSSPRDHTQTHWDHQTSHLLHSNYTTRLWTVR